MFLSVPWEDGARERETFFFHSECLGSIFEENSYWTITPVRKWFRKWLCFLSTWTINRLPFRAESICPQSTQLVSILYLCYGFSRYAYLLYAFPRYAFLCYAYLRYGFFALCLFALCLFALCLFALCFFALYLFALCLFALCLLPLSMPFCILTSCMIPETGFCPSASVWCIPDLEQRIGLLQFSFGLMHVQLG